MSRTTLVSIMATLFISSATTTTFENINLCQRAAFLHGDVKHQLQLQRPQCAQHKTVWSAQHAHAHASPLRRTGIVAIDVVTRNSAAGPSDDDCDCTTCIQSRRESIRHIVNIAGGSSLALLSSGLSDSSAAWAIQQADIVVASSPPESEKSSKKEIIEYASERDKFSISIPASFRVTNNSLKPPPKSINSKGKGYQLFSALDFNSGTVITVHREKACPVSEYVSHPERCDLILPPVVGGDDGILSSERSLEKDAKKILVRHDDRDNAVLGGLSTLQSVEMVKGRDNDGLFIISDTVLPTGGTYVDGMGIRKESTITRVVKTRVVSQSEGDSDDSLSLLSIWISAPMDEWQKPVMGTKLNQIMDSVSIKGGRLEQI